MFPYPAVQITGAHAAGYVYLSLACTRRCGWSKTKITGLGFGRLQRMFLIRLQRSRKVPLYFGTVYVVIL